MKHRFDGTLCQCGRRHHVRRGNRSPVTTRERLAQRAQGWACELHRIAAIGQDLRNDSCRAVAECLAWCVVALRPRKRRT